MLLIRSNSCETECNITDGRKICDQYPAWCIWKKHIAGMKGLRSLTAHTVTWMVNCVGNGEKCTGHYLQRTSSVRHNQNILRNACNSLLLLPCCLIEVFWVEYDTGLMRKAFSPSPWVIQLHGKKLAGLIAAHMFHLDSFICGLSSWTQFIINDPLSSTLCRWW